jgi:hypothetical protein
MADSTSALDIGFRFADHSQTATSNAIAQRTQQPFCAVDGVEHACSWNEYTRIDVTPGKHKIETFTRFKGVPIKRFKGKTEVTIDPGEYISVTAQMGQFKTKYVTGTGSS